MSRLPLAFAAIVALTACDPSRPDLGGTESTTIASAGVRSTSAAAGAGFKSIAAKIVERSADVRENEIVELAGNVEDLPLLEDMAIEVRKRGAHPIVLVQTEQFGRRLYDEIPARYDGQAPLAGRKLVEAIDVFITTEAGEGRTYRGVPPERQAARAKASQPLVDLARKRGIRSVFLGNGLYPSEERAEQFGMDRDDLAGLMYAGIDADYGRLQATGKRLGAALTGNELRITNTAGTDLRIRMAGRPVYVSDGVISAEDRKRGGTALSVWLPAGEVYFTPAPGTAEGTVVADRYYHQGDRIDGLRLEIAGGKVVGMSAKSGLEPLKARYEAGGAGRDLVGVVDFGINPSLRVPEGKAVNVWSRAGAVTIVIGNNQWAGGSNSSDFSIAPEIARATVTVDGKPIVQGGELVETPAVAAR
jgi:leucyl aminopeptidase (aminopeptidase T)